MHFGVDTVTLWNILQRLLLLRLSRKKIQERSFRINYRRQSNNIAFGCSSKSCGVETNADLHV